jgi:hypothetical protein
MRAKFPAPEDGPIAAPPVPPKPIIPPGKIVESDKSKIANLETRVAELETRIAKMEVKNARKRTSTKKT